MWNILMFDLVLLMVKHLFTVQVSSTTILRTYVIVLGKQCFLLVCCRFCLAKQHRNRFRSCWKTRTQTMRETSGETPGEHNQSDQPGIDKHKHDVLFKLFYSIIQTLFQFLTRFLSSADGGRRYLGYVSDWSGVGHPRDVCARLGRNLHRPAQPPT